MQILFPCFHFPQISWADFCVHYMRWSAMCIFVLIKNSSSKGEWIPWSTRFLSSHTKACVFSCAMDLRWASFSFLFCREVSDWFGQIMGFRGSIKKEKARLIYTKFSAVAQEESFNYFSIRSWCVHRQFILFNKKTKHFNVASRITLILKIHLKFLNSVNS